MLLNKVALLWLTTTMSHSPSRAATAYHHPATHHAPPCHRPPPRALPSTRHRALGHRPTAPARRDHPLPCHLPKCLPATVPHTALNTLWEVGRNRG
jgi:hypothetical protein